MKKRSFEAGRQVKAYAANRPIQRRNWLNRIEYSPNLQALSLFRILFAGYLFVHFLSVLPYYSDFYGAAGIMPLSALATDQTLYGVANMSSLVRLFDALGIGAIAPAAYPLSLRHIEEMMAERGVVVDHTTVHRWAVKILPVLAAVLRRRKRPVGTSWRMDETYILVGGQWKYLYRAVDRAGDTIDFLLCAHRDCDAARRFFERAMDLHGVPDKITIDKRRGKQK